MGSSFNDWKGEYLPFTLISYLFLIPINLLALKFKNELFWVVKREFC
jgi:hypothetical protein